MALSDVPLFCFVPTGVLCRVLLKPSHGFVRSVQSKDKSLCLSPNIPLKPNNFFFFFFFKPLAAVSGMWQNAKEAKKPGNLIEGQQEHTASDEWLRHIMSLQHLLWSSSLETIHWNVSAHWGKQRSFSFVRKYAPTWGRIGFQDGVVVMLVVTM